MKEGNFRIRGLLTIAASLLIAQVTSPGSEVLSRAIVQRGYDYSVQETLIETFQDGVRSLTTNRVTLLENNLNYREGGESGEWKASEDIIESFPDGAITRRGPNRAIFSHNLNADAVFDILAYDGQRLRGGVRSIHLTDGVSGESTLLATVKPDATGELLPPNKIIYRDAFEGSVRADVVLVWKHNFFCQDVILRSKPLLPAGLSADSTHFEVVTEFLDAPVAELDDATAEDHSLIRFGSLNMIAGEAYPVEEGTAVSFGAAPSHRQGNTNVRKSWEKLPDGRSFLVESVPWHELAPHLDNLELSALNPAREVEVANTRVWPATSRTVSDPAPIQLASAAYNPEGYLLDFIIVPAAQPTTFETGKTYVITANYYVNSATFQAGCVIKNIGTASVCLTGTFSFPDTLQSCVFTSVDDDSFGERFTGSSNPTIPASDGDPSNNVSDDALRIWYGTSSSEVRSSIFRWALTGIEYFNTGASANHTIRNCRFENIQWAGTAPAISVYIPSSRTVTFIDSEKSKVDQDKYVVQGNVSGTLTTEKFYGDKSFAGIWVNESPTINWPDTMGAIGPNYIVEMVNRKIAVFDRRTNPVKRIREAALSEFFSVTLTAGDLYPKGQVGDPRIIYDHISDRWYACALDIGTSRKNNRVLFAVSNDSNPVVLDSTASDSDLTWITTKWKQYLLKLNDPDLFADYPTLGVDKNGVYITAHYNDYNAGLPMSKRMIAALPIGPLLAGTAPVELPSNSANVITSPVSEGGKVIQPALNFESAPPSDVVWLVTKDAPSASPYRPGKVLYGRLKWNAATGLFEKQPNWFGQSVALNVPTALSYWDIPDDNGGGFDAPQLPKAGMNSQIPLRIAAGTHILSAVLQDGNLWVVQHVGFNQSGSYSGSGTPDRSGLVWYKYQVDSTQSPPVLNHTSPNATYGRIWDSSASNYYWYFYPSLMVNSLGDMLIGASGSRSTEYVGAFAWGRRSDGSTLSRPLLVQSGRDFFYIEGSTRWGDYSGTALDPNDSESFCTFQEYAQSNGSDLETILWGTWITTIKLGP